MNGIKYTLGLGMTMTLFFLVLIISCKSSKSTGETMQYKEASAGQVHVVSSGFGKTKGKSVNNAIENAVTNLLLRGIPDSNQKLPMLGNNAESVFKKNKGYFTKFFEKEVEKFIINREVSRFKFLNVNEPSTDVKLLINTASLRQHLISDGIIRAFGI